MITDTIYELQTIHRNISGIKTAPLVLGDYPPQIRTAQLPIVLTVPADSTWSMRTHSGDYDEIRSYRVMVYVDPVAQGKPFEYAETALGLIEIFGIVYLKNYKLATNKYIDISNIQDTGLQVKGYAGIDYHGFEYNLSIRSY